jgi:hypothetical protein
MRRFAVLAMSLVLWSITAQAADTRFTTNQEIWERGDKCNRDALARWPDYTAEALQKREKYVHDCNLRSNTPARVPFVAPSQIMVPQKN